MLEIYLIFLVLFAIALATTVLLNKSKIDGGSIKKNIIPVWVFMVFVCFLGLLAIALDPLISVGFIPTPTSWTTDFVELFKAILQNLGQALFVGGVVGIIFEIGSVKQYFERSIAKILIDDEYLKYQEDAELMRLRQRATENIYLKKSKNIDSDLIKLDQKICQSLTEPFFDYYKQSSVCTMAENRSYIKKTIRTRFKLVNPQLKHSNFLLIKPWRSRMSAIEDINNDSLRTLIDFDVAIDDNPMKSVKQNFRITKVVEPAINESTDYTIATELNFVEGLDGVLNESLNFEDTFEGSMVEERFFPLDDLNYSFRINTLVRNFSLNFTFDNPNVRLTGNLYGTMANPREGISIDKDSNSISLESKRWMLKGNGAYVNIIPRNWSLT